MPLSEGVSQTIAYKKYALGTITAGTEAISSSDLVASGAQYLRRVGSTLKLAKATYQSAEIRSDRQIADFRHGGRSVSGSITGELSPATYFDFFEATHRDTKAAVLTLSQSQLTSVTASHSASTFTFAGGDPVALGLCIGSVIRFTNLSVTADNSQNFLITGISGASNRILNVSPAPTDQTLDSSFTLTRPGVTTIVPLTGHVSRKFGIESYGSDIDISRLFTECRASMYKITAPSTGMVTTEFGFMGRDMETYSAASAPFFTTPTANTTTGIVSAVNGSLFVAGASTGVVTGIDFGCDLSPTAATVLGQNFAAEIFLGRANITGTVTAYFDSLTMVNDFLNETEIALDVMMTTTSATNSPFINFFFPRIKFSDAAINLQGEGGQTISMPFQALLAPVTTGVKQSTVFIQDSEAT